MNEAILLILILSASIFMIVGTCLMMSLLIDLWNFDEERMIDTIRDDFRRMENEKQLKELQKIVYGEEYANW